MLFLSKKKCWWHLFKETESGIKNIYPRRVFSQQSETGKSKYKALS